MPKIVRVSAERNLEGNRLGLNIIHQILRPMNYQELGGVGAEAKRAVTIQPY